VNLPSLLNIAIGGLTYLASDFIFAPPTGAIMRTEVENLSQILGGWGGRGWVSDVKNMLLYGQGRSGSC